MNQLFETIITIALVSSAIIGLIDIFFFAKDRKARVYAEHPQLDTLPKKKRKELLKAPLLADYARSLFPVFLIVLILRQFVFGLFVVPTGSMLPTIQLDEFLYVNKLAYNLDLPFSTTPLAVLGKPKRGDVAVFHYPVDPDVDFIKTIIALPGDKVSYINKRFYINGKELPQTFIEHTIEPTNANLGSTTVNLYDESIGSTTHTIYTTPAVKPGMASPNFYNLMVPKGYYLAIGDNRDNSEDSRFWGFVPENYLVGKAEFIFFSWDSKDTKVRWDRVFKRLP